MILRVAYFLLGFAIGFVVFDECRAEPILGKEFETDRAAVVVVWYPDYKALQAEYERRWGEEGVEVWAWSEYAEPEDGWGDCEIHAVAPIEVTEDPTYAIDALGHELLHCLWGQYHEDEE